MQIISADERLREQRGAKVLLLGPPGVGKTWQLRTFDPAQVLFVDVEAGDLSVIDLAVRSVRPQTWSEVRDLVCRLGGPNKSFPPTLPYSQAHYESLGGALPDADQYEIIFMDSITAITRLAFRHAEQQPEAYSERTGKKDIRGAYGLMARDMLLLLHHLQHTRGKHVVLVGVLERNVDDFNVATWQLQCEGQKTARELPAIVDNVITYQFLDFVDGKPPRRGFVCTSPNPWGFPAKDRSGKLDQVEEPDLGKLLTKLTRKPQANGESK